jgi:hypothetical protein
MPNYNYMLFIDFKKLNRIQTGIYAEYSTMLCRIFSGVLVGAALLIAATPGGAAATPVAAVEYRLELRIDPAAQLIEGVATLAFPVPTAPPSKDWPSPPAAFR